MIHDRIFPPVHTYKRDQISNKERLLAINIL